MSSETQPQSEEAILDGLNLDDMVPVKDTIVKPKRKRAKTDTEPEPELPAIEPLIHDPEWQTFVMSQFTNDEIDESGNPLVAGLRRVARKLLGRLLESKSTVVQAPNFVNAESTRLRHTVVSHSITILWQKDLDCDERPYECEFTDVADVELGNCDPEYLRFPTATAATRAEGRALRKALMLNRVAAEEKTLVPVDEAAMNGKITTSQITFLDILCQRNDINVMGYANMGKKKFDRIEDIPYETAEKMSKHLSHLQTNSEEIGHAIKGYDSNWRN